MKNVITTPYFLTILLLFSILLVFPSISRAETVQIYASSGDAAITSSGSTDWHVVRTNGNNLSIDTTATERNVYTDESFAIRRLYFPFDTSVIPFGAQITSATLHLTHPHNNYLDSDGLSAGLILGHQSSLTSLTTSDWGPNSFVRIASDIDMTSFNSNDQTIAYQLNEIGRGSLQKGAGGITSIILATSADIDDNPGAVAGGNYVDVYMSETSGTSKDPYLEVTYVYGTTTQPTNLKVNGQTSPQTLSDATPNLTLYYDSFNDVGKATLYQIQVSISSSDWSGTALQWDSKKTPFSQSVASGTTSPAITFPETLTASTTYYWRARIWDEYANISDWSSTANFKTNNSLTIQIYPESSDGAITSGGSTSWSTVRSGNNLSIDTTATERNVYTDESFAIRRLYFPFDTSLIPSDATLSTTTFNLVHPHNNQLNIDGLSVGLIEGSVADIGSLSTSDWEPISFDRLSSDKAISSFTSTKQTIQWTLNATGTNAINLGAGASTTLVLATSADIDDNPGAVAGGNYVDFYMLESAYSPYLEVAYSR